MARKNGTRRNETPATGKQQQIAENEMLIRKSCVPVISVRRMGGSVFDMTMFEHRFKYCSYQFAWKWMEMMGSSSKNQNEKCTRSSTRRRQRCRPHKCAACARAHMLGSRSESARNEIPFECAETTFHSYVHFAYTLKLDLIIQF